MKSKLKRILLYTVAFIVLAFVVFINYLTFNHARAMLTLVDGAERPPKIETLGRMEQVKLLLHGIAVPRPRAKISDAELAKDFEVFSITGSDGVRLGAAYGPEGDQSVIVPIFHGYGQDKTDMLDQARAFRSLGYSVLLVDFRGSGSSSESYTTIGYDESKDVVAAVAYLTSKHPASKLVLYGRSMGAVAVLRAIYTDKIQPDAIILESPFDSLLNTVKNRFNTFPYAELLVMWGSLQYRFNGFEHKPTKYAKSVTCPALFLHGTDDPKALLADARRVYDAIPGVKYFTEFQGGKHEAFVRRFREEWFRAVTDFLNTTHLAVPTPQKEKALTQ
jgi:uncharacterized protein